MTVMQSNGLGMTQTAVEDVLSQLQALASPKALAEQQRVGIRSERQLGVSVYELRRLAKGKRDHALALALWESGWHEARLLASLVDDPAQVTREQMEAWMADFDTWDMCDVVCDNLFSHVEGAVANAHDWSARQPEFTRRAGFTMMAVLAALDKTLTDEVFLGFLPDIESAVSDERKYVKKAANWALRNIGKRNPALRQAAIACAERIALVPSPAARWIASDALRELRK